ncbi:MAG: ATP-binding protein [Calditrichia bacterium]
MKKFFSSFYGKISTVFLLLLLLLGGAQIYITLQSSMRFVNEADQKLNLQLAHNMAAELTPFLKDSLSLPVIEEKIHYMMVMNPKVEIYLLNGEGKILAFFADPPKKVQKEFVDLEPVKAFFQRKEDKLFLGDDPRHPGRQKPFSVAPIHIGESIDGYLYIILGGEQYDTAAQMIRESYILKTSLKSLLITLFFAAIIGMILFAFLTRRLRAMTHVVQKFEQGKLEERVEVKSHDEIGQLAGSFNKMADTIAANIEELKRTDHLRRELIANVSHDLRSPLASIQGYLETVLIKNKSLSEQERQKYFDIILNNTAMLSRLVEELFQLSKLDAKQVQPHPEPFSIAELAQDVVLKFKPRAEKSRITLEAIQPPKLPLVMGDIGLIERVLANLIENALQYTPPNGMVKVVLSDGEQGVRVVVSDSGQGIPPEDIPHVFERFYRVDKSRSRTKGGTGLGLAIAKKILELHDSKISVESELNVGTKFFFDLPVWNGK